MSPSRALAAFGLAVLVGAPAAAQQGQIVFEQQVLDLGTIEQHDERALSFEFRVAGGPVTVSAVDTSCGCARGRLFVGDQPWPLGEPLPAGTAGTVAVDFKAGLYIGDKRATVALLHDDEVLAAVQVAADILQVYAVEPELVSFGSVARGEGAFRDVQVRGIRPWAVTEWQKLPHGVTVEDVTAEHDMFGADARDEPPADEQGRQRTRWLRLRIPAGAPEGGVHGAAVAETSLGKPLTIPLSAKIVGRITVDPNGRVRFGLVRDGQQQERSVFVRDNSASRDLPAPAIELSGSEHFTATVSPGRWPGVHEVRITLAAGAPAGKHDAELRLVWTGALADESRTLAVAAVVAAPK